MKYKLYKFVNTSMVGLSESLTKFMNEHPDMEIVSSSVLGQYELFVLCRIYTVKEEDVDG